MHTRLSSRGFVAGAAVLGLAILAAVALNAWRADSANRQPVLARWHREAGPPTQILRACQDGIHLQVGSKLHPVTQAPRHDASRTDTVSLTAATPAPVQSATKRWQVQRGSIILDQAVTLTFSPRIIDPVNYGRTWIDYYGEFTLRWNRPLASGQAFSVTTERFQLGAEPNVAKTADCTLFH